MVLELLSVHRRAGSLRSGKLDRSLRTGFRALTPGLAHHPRGLDLLFLKMGIPCSSLLTSQGGKCESTRCPQAQVFLLTGWWTPQQVSHCGL